MVKRKVKLSEEQEILNDKEVMKQLKESLRNYKKGKVWELKY